MCAFGWCVTSVITVRLNFGLRNERKRGSFGGKGLVVGLGRL